jgi:hypothetical protein
VGRDRFRNSGSQQKLNGRFDVPISRVYDEGMVETMLDEDWFDIEDFTEAMSIARKRLQETPQIFRQETDSAK